MGNSASASDRALAASATGDVRTMQKIIQYFPQGSSELKLVLDARDKEGRSCLTIAAMKNQVSVAKLLLQHGADVHYICKMASRSTTALHEASSRRHDEMVELLLQYGANPFLANSHGETPMELAVLAGALKIVHSFERRALFVGQVEVQWTKMLGGPAYKPRRVVIMDHFPCPKPGQALPPTRRQLWIHSTERDDVMPKCRVWLDGSSAIRVGNGNEAVLRLAQTHVQPVGKLYTRFSNGYCLFLKALATTAARNDSWERLLQLCNVNEALSVPTIAPALKGATGSALPVGILPSPAPAPHSSASATGPSPGHARPTTAPLGHVSPSPARSAASGLQPSAHSYPVVSNLATPLPAPPPSYPGAPAGPPGGDGFLWGMPPPQHAQYGGHAYGSGNGAALPPRASPGGYGAQGGYGAGAGPGVGPNGQRQPGVGSTGGLDLTSALPGESDAAFAARLAALSAGGALGGGGGGSSSAAVDMHALRMAEAALQPNAGGRHSGSNPYGGGHGGAGTSAAYWSPAPAAAHPDHAPSAPPLHPSAPPAPAAVSAAAPAPSAEVDDSCVICMCAPREAGFLHGGTVHRCVCNDCAKQFQKDHGRRKEMPCPVCRQPVEQIITIF